MYMIPLLLFTLQSAFDAYARYVLYQEAKTTILRQNMVDTASSLSLTLQFYT